jgi:hypothetical protein
MGPPAFDNRPLSAPAGVAAGAAVASCSFCAAGAPAPLIAGSRPLRCCSNATAAIKIATIQ